MAESDDGLNENLAWATESQLLDELFKRYDALVFAGVKDVSEKGGVIWHRLLGCPFRVEGLASFIGESAACYLFKRFPPDFEGEDDDEEDWKKGRRPEGPF